MNSCDMCYNRANCQCPGSMYSYPGYPARYLQHQRACRPQYFHVSQQHCCPDCNCELFFLGLDDQGDLCQFKSTPVSKREASGWESNRG
ncbi:hypothetical protein Ciccas_009315 [Cichlidogyrus casuarinus]|uniref:Uncharacterized protein n=1 Tax=Cichlidogyrus casuarinus TaxID=1844966 RepID=A0ABD2PXE0_9PLAT